MDTDRDLVVVGGGPVGVMTALLCAQRGLTATVVERDTEVVNTARAIAMDDEIQRVFQGAGLADRLAAITTRSRGAEFVGVDGTRHVGIEIPDDHVGALGHWPTVMYHQPMLEALLREAAVESGVELLLGRTVTAVEPSVGADGVGLDPAGVLTRLDDGARLNSRWVVAADGASSGVRKQLGVAFEDLGFDQDWLVVDTRLVRGVDLPPLVQQICDPARPTTFVPGHGPYRRWEFQAQPGETRDELTDPGRVAELLAPWVAPADVVVERAVVYRFHATVAEAFRVGPIFLAGDAAHQMPPFLGQGLCSGVRDAANLAWKLAMVHDGLAGDALLDSYDAERRPHAAGLIAHAADTGRLIDQLAGRVESGVATDAGYGGGRPFPVLEHGLLVRGHPMVGRQLPQPRLGDELLDARLGAGWAVVAGRDEVVADEVAERWRSVGGRVVALGDDWSTIPFAPADGAIVVRPDRYVAAVADGTDELTRATDDLFDRLPATA